MIPKEILSLTNESLRCLKRCIAESCGRIPSRAELRQILGAEEAVVYAWLAQFSKTYGDVAASCEVIAAVMEARGAAPKPEALFDLILSGPEVDDVPTCATLPTIHHLIHEAESDFLICDYAIFGAESIFQHLSEALEGNQDLRVRLILNVFRTETDGDTEKLFDAFRDNVLRRHWVGRRPPEIYVDPRSASPDASQKASMHAKCFVADRKAALITSANLTDAAHRKNIEAGVVVRYEPMVERLVSYFDALIEEGILTRI